MSFICFAQTKDIYQKIDSLIALSGNSVDYKIKELKKIHLLSKKHAYAYGLAMNSQNIGVYYMNKLMNDSANYYFSQAIKIAKKNPNLDVVRKYAYGNKGVMFANKGQHTKALHNYKKALRFSKKDTLILKLDILDAYNGLNREDYVIEELGKFRIDSLIKNEEKRNFVKYRYNQTLARSYEQKEDFFKAIQIWEENKLIADSSDYIAIKSFDRIKISNLYIKMDSLTKASKYLNQAYEINNRTKNKMIIPFIYETKALLAHHLKKYKQSNLYLDSLEGKSILSNESLTKTYVYRSKNYRHLKEYKKAINAIDKYLEITDSLQEIKNKDIAEFYDSDLVLINQKRKNKRLLRKNEKQKLNIYVLLLALLSLFLILAYTQVLKRYRKGEKTINMLIEDEKLLFEEQIKKREEELISTSSFVREQMDKIGGVKELVNAIKKNQMKQQVVEINNKLNEILISSNYIVNIGNNLESNYPNLVTILRKAYPQLTTHDIKHCILLKLNLSIKECSQILHVSDHAVKMARKRIKKKLDLPDNLKLKDYLINLY
ncbi:tetratricopeptide repeat protein [Aquimarina aggregata]|uniref:tetratricopeptide repeat protein n=1 Tax=Aquimarina aggregata TaxID=1642818 RepID=UPI0024909235|nr:hypothetical protein [Aquimarina aggregata]